MSPLLRALSVCVALALGAFPAAFAESSAPEALTAPIGAQPLAEALDAFAEQTGLHVVYVSDVVRNQKSQAVPAGLSAKDALARLLQGTGLKSEFFTAGSVRILADERPTGPAVPNESQPFMQSVVVTGARIPVPANITATSPLVVMTANWDVTGHVQLRAGVNNVLDKDPPFVPSADVSSSSSPLNTYPTYGVAGREVYVALRAKL